MGKKIRHGYLDFADASGLMLRSGSSPALGL